jgi:hypothetical protein
MRLFHRLVRGSLAATLLVLAGCGNKLNDKRTLTVKPSTVEKVFFDAPLVDKATVVVKSPGAPVNIHIVFAKDAEAAGDAIQEHRPIKDPIVGAERTEEKTLEFQPGKKPFAILISVGSSRPAEVQLTVTGQ